VLSSSLVSQSVSFFDVSMITQNQLNRFSQYSVKGWHTGTEETVGFGGNPDHFTLGLGTVLWLRLSGDQRYPETFAMFARY